MLVPHPCPLALKGQRGSWASHEPHEALEDQPERWAPTGMALSTVDPAVSSQTSGEFILRRLEGGV